MRAPHAKPARRMAMREKYDRLSTEERQRIEGQILTQRPELRTRPGIVSLLAVDLFAAERGEQEPPAAE